MALDENIKKYRKQKGFTQKELASKSGLSFSMISKLESGEQLNPSYQTIKKIANALNIYPEKLVNETNFKAVSYNDSCSDLNFRVKLQAINSITIPKENPGYDPFESLYRRPEIKKLLTSLSNVSKEEIEQLITFIEVFQKH